MNIKMRQALVCFKGFFGQITRVRASISLSTFCAQVSNASFQRATSHARSLNLREVSLSSQVVYREKKSKKMTEGRLKIKECVECDNNCLALW